MGKVIFWLVVFFVVLFALRLINAAGNRSRNGDASSRKTPEADAMTRCVECGIYLPVAEATEGPRGPVCGEVKCLERARGQPRG